MRHAGSTAHYRPSNQPHYSAQSAHSKTPADCPHAPATPSTLLSKAVTDCALPVHPRAPAAQRRTRLSLRSFPPASVIRCLSPIYPLFPGSAGVPTGTSCAPALDGRGRRRGQRTDTARISSLLSEAEVSSQIPMKIPASEGERLQKNGDCNRFPNHARGGK
jgi:hypothetical protein